MSALETMSHSSRPWGLERTRTAWPTRRWSYLSETRARSTALTVTVTVGAIMALSLDTADSSRPSAVLQSWFCHAHSR